MSFATRVTSVVPVLDRLRFVRPYYLFICAVVAGPQMGPFCQFTDAADRSPCPCPQMGSFIPQSNLANKNPNKSRHLPPDVQPDLASFSQNRPPRAQKPDKSRQLSPDVRLNWLYFARSP